MQDFLPAEQATAFLELYKKKGLSAKTDSPFAYKISDFEFVRNSFFSFKLSTAG